MQAQKMMSSLFILLALSLMVACGSQPSGSAPADSPVTAKTYIANFDNGPDSARAVIVVEEGKFDAYVCSLDDAFNLTTARWYKGELGQDGSFQGVSNDGVEFKGTVTGDKFTGTVINTAKENLAFNGLLVPADGKAGLYRGTGQYGDGEVIVGAVIDPDGTFASTAQYKGKFEFVSPVAPEPVQVSNSSLGIKIGDSGEQIIVDQVKTLKGPQVF
jgi:hypothetical protein